MQKLDFDKRNLLFRETMKSVKLNRLLLTLTAKPNHWGYCTNPRVGVVRVRVRLGLGLGLGLA